jgi:hypothetical protein
MNYGYSYINSGRIISPEGGRVACLFFVFLNVSPNRKTNCSERWIIWPCRFQRENLTIFYKDQFFMSPNKMICFLFRLTKKYGPWVKKNPSPLKVKWRLLWFETICFVLYQQYLKCIHHDNDLSNKIHTWFREG